PRPSCCPRCCCPKGRARRPPRPEHLQGEAMKLVRHGAPGAERAGLLDAQGTVRDVSMLVPDIGPAQLDPRTLAALAAIDARRLPAVPPGTRLGCPVGGVGKIVCVGLNYADHAREAGLEPPAE